MYKKYIKRLLDIIISLIAIVILSPIYLILIVAIKFKLGSPVIFKQRRPGKNGVIFHLYKFRTMLEAKDENGEDLPDEMRLTKFGRLLRSTSLDELPEFINILIGNMSLVGPRPLAEQYLPYYNDTESHRHDVLPGLTGLAQVNGRTAISWENRFKYDVEYVNNITFFNDCIIIIKTIKKVFCRDDIVEAGSQGDFDKWRIQELNQKEKGVEKNDNK